MIVYSSDFQGVDPSQLAGFFVGWPNPPDQETHLRILKGSSHVVLALDGERVVGFINAISDGVLAAYLPLLEVLPEYQGRGIGGELVQRMLALLKDYYMVDLACDEALIPFYERFGLRRLTAAGRRNYERQSGMSEAD
ncbi:MAG TPA: GNAT family N-acetyltransferase [candidate division Zixibacteria bacterium]|nr:GNAT family N-acetyltransferase [candidate division Zixibacteria bacterium]